MTDVVEHPEEFDKGEFAWRRLFLCERVEVEFVDGEEPGMGKTRVSPDGCQRGHLTDPDEQWHWRADAETDPDGRAAEWAGSDSRSDARTELRGSGIGARTRTVEGLGRTATLVHGARCWRTRGAGLTPFERLCPLFPRFCSGLLQRERFPCRRRAHWNGSCTCRRGWGLDCRRRVYLPWLVNAYRAALMPPSPNLPKSWSVDCGTGSSNDPGLADVPVCRFRFGQTRLWLLWPPSPRRSLFGLGEPVCPCAR